MPVFDNYNDFEDAILTETEREDSVWNIIIGVRSITEISFFERLAAQVGWDVINVFTLDPRKEGNHESFSLLEELHKKGLNIILAENIGHECLVVDDDILLYGDLSFLFVQEGKDGVYSYLKWEGNVKEEIGLLDTRETIAFEDVIVEKQANEEWEEKEVEGVYYSDYPENEMFFEEDNSTPVGGNYITYQALNNWNASVYNQKASEGGVPFSFMLDVFVSFYQKEYGELSTNEIAVKLYTSKKANKFLIETAQRKLRPGTNDYLAVVHSSSHFMFAKAEKICFASVMLLHKWNIEVGKPLGIADNEYLTAVFSSLITKASKYKAHISSTPNFFDRFKLYLESIATE